MKVAFLGNFQVRFSTESHHAWTWEKLGHQVIRLQENQVTTEAVVDACRQADLFQWTHTHSFATVGRWSLLDMVQKIRELKIPSFTYHLDLYWGLNTLDRREEKVGQHASWKLDYVFTTDGGNQARYEAQGVNHRYLPPAVVEYACEPGGFRNDLASDIGFVGSVGYHPEHPFRRTLVESLRNRYGNRFRIYQGLREKPLNDAYASIRAVVGDHCFSDRQIPYYWSDRLPETAGRAGFIIYPFSEGLQEWENKGLVTYKGGDLADLEAKIDYYLDPTHENERLERKMSLFEYVRANHTYTNRLQEILRIMGLGDEGFRVNG